MIRKSILLIFLLLPVLVFPQGENLKITTRAGYDGYYRPGQWTPVFVDIDNRPVAGDSLDSVEEFNGQLLISSAPISGEPLRFSRDVTVPASSVKRYIIYGKFSDSPPDTGHQLVLSLPNGKRIFTFPLDLKPADPDRLIAVHVSNQLQRPNLPALGGGLDRLIFTSLPPDELPDFWGAWDGADIVVMDGWPDSGASEAQSNALRDFAAMGGTLVFLAGQSSASYVGESAERLLPVSLIQNSYLYETEAGLVVKDQGPEKDSEDRVYIVSRSSPKDGAQTLLENGGVPLVVNQEVGEGRVVFFAVDFKAASIELEQAFQAAWQSLIPLVNQASAEYSIPDAISEFASLTGRAASVPNPFVIILISFVYLIVVGPLNFGVLAKLKKLEFAWFTLPVIVLVFFFLIYTVGQFMKGNISLYRELEIRRTVSGQQYASVNAVTNTFVSSEGAHRVRPLSGSQALADSFQWHSPPDYIGNVFGQFAQNLQSETASAAAGSPLISYDTNLNQVYARSWPMGTFDARSFVTRGPEAASERLEHALYFDGSAIQGNVVNSTPYTYQKCYLAAGDKIWEIGALDPGEGWQVPGGGLYLNRLAPEWLDAANLFSDMRLTRPETGEDVALNNFGVYFRKLHNPAYTGNIFPPERNQFKLIAMRYEDNPVRLPESTIRPDIHTRSEIDVIDLNLKPAPGRQTISGDFVKLTFLDFEKANIGGLVNFGNDGHLEFSKASVFVAVDSPFVHPGMRVESFQISDLAQVDNTLELNYYVYNQNRTTSPRWFRIPRGQPVSNELESGVMAMPVSGRMFLRIDAYPPNSGDDPDYGHKVTLRQLKVAMSVVVE